MPNNTLAVDDFLAAVIVSQGVSGVVKIILDHRRSLFLVDYVQIFKFVDKSAESIPTLFNRNLTLGTKFENCLMLACFHYSLEQLDQ